MSELCDGGCKDHCQQLTFPPDGALLDLLRGVGEGFSMWIRLSALHRLILSFSPVTFCCF